MNHSVRIWGLAASLCFCAAFAVAAEPYNEFLAGLRNREYYDYALIYLDQLATRPGLPAEIKQVIPYEKAVTLLSSAAASRSPEKQVEQLDQALAFLDQFVKESPEHPQAADANTERAQILLGKARVEIVQSRSPANQGNRSEYQNKARGLIAKAREVFKTALDQHEAAMKRYGTFIDKAKDPEKAEARAKSEVNMIKAQLDLAQCIYEEAQTHPVGDAEQKRLLNDAAAAFEQMHQRYRSQVGGLYARLWQGKCFEEQGDLQKALGIYNELVDNPGNDGPMAKLKDQTLQFKLICLNTKERGDYQLVIDLGEEWLKKHGAEARSRVGLGIRWEVARAYEQLGDKRDLPKADAQRYWREARENAQQVSKSNSEHRDIALAFSQRLDTKLGGKERLPDKFDTAFGLGRQLITPIKDGKDALDAAIRAKKPAEDIKKLQQDLNAQLKEAAQYFEIALRLANKSDDQKSITQCRFSYAYVCYLMRKNYEAAILGEYVAKAVDKDDSSVGLDAAFLSLAAYVQAFNDVKGSNEDKEPDMRFIINAANLITVKWPESDRANDARMQLGEIYGKLKKPVLAAEWYNKVPATDPKYPYAQLAAGQSYWAACLGADRLPDAEKPTPQQLDEWKQLALKLLRNGNEKLLPTIPKEGAPPNELIASKFAQAQIVITLGQDAEAIKLLLDDPQSVIKAITVPDETKRPDKGVQSRLFATECYKLLLRAYIGGGKLNEARDTMKTLEKVAGADAGNDVTDLYVGLGKLLSEELDRLKDAREMDRFNQLMTSFETFLNDLYQRKDGQTFGSLSWIGETYFALGEASSEDPARMAAYFEKAGSAFQDLLNMGDKTPGFLTPDQVAAVKVRLVRCHRLKKDFETAERVIVEVLNERDKEPRAQAEAAHVYQDWGIHGGTENAPKFLAAINGEPKKKIWGWRLLGTKLQKEIERGRTELIPQFVESRVEGVETRRQLGLSQTSPEKRRTELDRCEGELMATVAIMRELSDDQLADLNEVYHKVLGDQGKPVVDLKVRAEVPIATNSDSPADTKTAVTTPNATKKKGKTVVKPAPASDLPMYIALGAIFLGGGAVVAYMFTRKTKSHKKLMPIPATDSVFASNGPDIVIGTAPAAKPRPRPAASSAAAATGTAATRPPGTRPANPATGTNLAAAKPKPKPKPPTTE